MSGDVKGFFVVYKTLLKQFKGEERYLGPYLKKSEAEYWAHKFQHIAEVGSVHLEQRPIVFPAALYDFS